MRVGTESLIIQKSRIPKTYRGNACLGFVVVWPLILGHFSIDCVEYSSSKQSFVLLLFFFGWASARCLGQNNKATLDNRCANAAALLNEHDGSTRFIHTSLDIHAVEEERTK